MFSWKEAYLSFQKSRTESALRQFSDASLAHLGITRDQIPQYVDSIYANEKVAPPLPQDNVIGANRNKPPHMAA